MIVNFTRQGCRSCFVVSGNFTDVFEICRALDLFLSFSPPFGAFAVASAKNFQKQREQRCATRDETSQTQREKMFIKKQTLDLSRALRRARPSFLSALFYFDVFKKSRLQQQRVFTVRLRKRRASPLKSLLFD